MASRKTSRQNTRMNQSLTDSWGIVDHESNGGSTNEAEASASDSEANYKSPVRRSKRRTESPTLSDEDATPRAVQSSRQALQSVRSTPPHTRSRQSAEPQFIMPTPDATPIRNIRRRTRRPAEQEDEEEGSHARTANRSDAVNGRIQREKAKRGLSRKEAQGNNYSSAWEHAIEPTLRYALSCAIDAASWTFYLLKIPMTILFALIMVRYLISAAIPRWMPISLPAIPGLDSLIISPCSLPIISTILPGCSLDSEPKVRPGAYEHMNSLQESWDRMLDIAQRSAPIPMQMNHAQAAIADTRNMIKHQSQLPSKAQLLMEIQTYLDLSKQATYEFTDFGSHVGRTVDRVISMNRLTLTSLDMFRNRLESSGIVGRALDVVLPGGYLKIAEGDVLDTYLRHASAIEEETDALIIEGEQVAFRLQEMENTLEEIRDTANKDLAGFTERKEELFAQLWTKLGGNAKDRKFVEKNIKVAGHLHLSAKDAAITVRAWLIELRTFKNDIIDLRARVNEPRGRASMDVLEIEEHIRYVEDGLNRLHEKRIEGKQQQQQGIQGLKQYVQGYWESKDKPVQIQGRKKREIDDSSRQTN